LASCPAPDPPAGSLALAAIASGAFSAFLFPVRRRHRVDLRSVAGRPLDYYLHIPSGGRTMPDPISNPMQPFINLMQANMALLSKYAMSPEAMSAAMAQFQAAMTQGPGAAKSVPQSTTAFAELAQGLMENYTRFMSELTASGMSLLTQGQEALLKAGAEAGRRGGSP
jgi:hypothetical protein